jgi:hypothetical protein
MPFELNVLRTSVIITHAIGAKAIQKNVFRTNAI